MAMFELYRAGITLIKNRYIGYTFIFRSFKYLGFLFFKRMLYSIFFLIKTAG